MPIAVGDIYKVIVKAQAGYGDDLDLVLHYTPATLFVPSDPLGTILDDFAALALVSLSQICSNVITFNKLQSRTLTLPVQGKELLVSVAGTQTGDPLPQQIAVQFLWQTDFLGRRFRGHNKMFYPSEAVLTGGVWTTAFLSTCDNVANDLTQLFDAATGLVPHWDLVVFSKANQAGEYVTSHQVTNDPRSQLSRTIARGS